MSKPAKTALLGLLIVVIVCAGISLLMAISKICPPAGPWPNPPWCSDTADSIFQSQEASTNADPEAETPNPYPVEKIWGYVAPTATLPAGSSVDVVFEAAFPPTEKPITLVIGEQPYPLTSENDFYFVSKPIQTNAGTTLDYHYTSDDKTTETRSILVQSDITIRDGLNWMGEQEISKPGFIKGYGIMDFGGFNVDELRGGRLPSTLTSMQTNGGEWFMFDYYWSYTDYTLPEIVDESIYPSMNYPTESDLVNMARTVHDQGMKFILLTSLEWSAIPGNPCFQYHGDADALAKCSNDYWLEGKAYEQSMLERLVDNPDDADALAYRDKWFAQYEAYMLQTARAAEENDIEMMIIGKNTIFADSPIHETLWRAVITKMREIYHGKIGLIFECYNDGCLSQKPWVDDMDAAIVFYWFRLSDADSPSNDSLRTEMNRINRAVISPFFQHNNVPVIIMTPFMSRDHPARQDWVEPASSAPEVGQDMIGQAELYELLFETSINEPWFNGVIPYGYWFFDGFHPDFAFDRSYNVREKPASAVLRSWFSRIDAIKNTP